MQPPCAKRFYGDYLIRYGGEEVIGLLPDTQLRRAMELADRLRRILETLADMIEYGPSDYSTCEAV